MLWGCWRGNNCLLYLCHLIKEQIHTNQEEALLHSIHGRFVDLIATGCCEGLNHKRDDLRPQWRGAYLAHMSGSGSPQTTEGQKLGEGWLQFTAFLHFMYLPLVATGHQTRQTFDLHQYGCWLDQLPPTGRALLIGGVMPRVVPPEGQTFKGPYVCCCHSNFQTCSTAQAQASFISSLSAQQICHREKSPPTQATFRWVGEEIGQQLRKINKVTTSLPMQNRAEGLCIWVFVALGFFFRGGCWVFNRTFENNNLLWELIGQKTKCHPICRLASVQACHIYSCKVILLPYPPLEREKQNSSFKKALLFWFSEQHTSFVFLWLQRVTWMNYH